MQQYSIQELSEKTSLPRRTIHFYVQQGLLPPPDGAGVGTRYYPIHLLCLQIIPLLQRKGLRLDEIRQKLSGLNEDRLLSLYSQEYDSQPPVPVFLPTSQPFAHYQLPAGMTLIVPATMTLAERKKLTEVLSSINQIFSS